MTGRYDPVGWADGDEAVLWECQECGVTVTRTDIHDGFHQRLIDVESLAAEIERAFRAHGSLDRESVMTRRVLG